MNIPAVLDATNKLKNILKASGQIDKIYSQLH